MGGLKTMVTKLKTRAKVKTAAKAKITTKSRGTKGTKGTTKVKIENVVASTDVKKTISLDKLLTTLESSEYEPEQFPGLVYRIPDPKVAFLIFSSGRIVCAGAKSLNQVKEAVEKLKKRLAELKA